MRELGCNDISFKNSILCGLAFLLASSLIQRQVIQLTKKIRFVKPKSAPWAFLECSKYLQKSIDALLSLRTSSLYTLSKFTWYF